MRMAVRLVRTLTRTSSLSVMPATFSTIALTPSRVETSPWTLRSDESG